jgi:hypothetical protein
MKVYKLEITGGAYGEEKEEVTVKAESPEVAIKLGLADLRREVIEIAKLTDTVYGVFTHIDETGLEVDVTEIGEEKGEARRYSARSAPCSLSYSRFRQRSPLLKINSLKYWRRNEHREIQDTVTARSQDAQRGKGETLE